MKIIFVRHGETDYNVEHRIQGNLDIPLNARGEEQAREIAHLVHSKEKIDMVMSSDLSRAFRTAEIIASHANIPCVPNSQWRERSMGPVEGMLHKDAIKKRKSDNLPSLLYYGENSDALRKRLVQAYQDILKFGNEKGVQCVLVVSHGSSLYNLFNELKRRGLVGFKSREVAQKFMKQPKLGNCSVTIIEDGKYECFAEQWTDSIVRERTLV